METEIVTGWRAWVAISIMLGVHFGFPILFINVFKPNMRKKWKVFWIITGAIIFHIGVRITELVL